MKRLMIVAVGVLGLTMGNLAYSGDLATRAALGGGIGGALGALVGADVGGRDGAVVGSALGAAVGTVVATDGHRHHGHVVYRESYPVYVDRTYVYVDDYRPRHYYYDGHRHRDHKHHYRHHDKHHYKRHHKKHHCGRGCRH